MEMFEARLKRPDIRMTYRAVGSGTGQTEFVGEAPGYTSLTHFASGDIPMSNERYTTITTSGSRQMAHIPFSLGAIGIFHSVPAGEVGVSGLKMSACLLAKVFSGKITQWDNAEILAENPDLRVPAGTKIQVGHRTLGSSSTGGLAGYLEMKCSASWGLGAGSSLSWPSTDTFMAVEGSPGMLHHISSMKYTIGYLDAGHGHQRHLSEVMLQNKDGNYLTSLQAVTTADTNGNNGVAAAGAAGVAASAIPADAFADWSAVNLFDQSGPSTWPIVLVSYIYLDRDIMNWTADEAGLLKAFVEFVVGTEGQQMLPEFSFNAIPASMNQFSAVWTDMTKPAAVTDFTFEDSTLPLLGQGENYISSKRDSYSLWKIGEMDLRLNAVTDRLQVTEQHLSDYGIVPLHGSGTTNPKTWFAKAMQQMEERSRVPLLLTYRAVGSGTGQQEFVGQSTNGYKSYSHFGCGDIPMSQSLFNSLPEGEEMVHVPFAMGAIGIFHSVPGATITADACLLAKIFNGDITTWDHSEIKAQNPSLSVPANQRIFVGHRMLGSSSTGGLTGYLQKKCPEVWTRGAGSSISWPTGDSSIEVEGSPGMQALIRDRAYSIGYLDAGHGHDLNFAEISLVNAAQTKQTSSASIAKGGVAAAGTEAINQNIFPATADSDWSGVNLYDMPGQDTWPIVLVSYFYIKKDQTRTNPRTAAALKAFVTMILENEEKLCEEFGFTAPSSQLKAKSLATLNSVVFPPSMEEFTFETSTISYGGMGENVISSKRHNYNEYDRGVLESKIESLEAALASLKVNVQTHSHSGSGGQGELIIPGEGQNMSHSHVAMNHEHEDDSDSTIAIIALIVAIVAILISSVPCFVAMRGPRKGGSMKNEGQTLGIPSM